jgi:hypothetical protein
VEKKPAFGENPNAARVDACPETLEEEDGISAC